MAIKNEAQEFNYDMLFAVKSLLFSVDKIHNPIFKSKKHLPKKSKREILRKLFNSSLYNAFCQWKHAMGLPSSFRQAKTVTMETLAVSIERIEAVLSKIVSSPPAPPDPQSPDIVRLAAAVARMQDSLSQQEVALRQMSEQIAAMGRQAAESPKRTGSRGSRGAGEGTKLTGALASSDFLIVGQQEEREGGKVQSVSELERREAALKQRTLSYPRYSPSRKRMEMAEGGRGSGVLK
eukprot:637742-Hanusia_phi.AAC.1